MARIYQQNSTSVPSIAFFSGQTEIAYNRRSTSFSVSELYVSTVLSDSPISYWRLKDSSPSGAQSVSDMIGSYNATPNGGITWLEATSIGSGTGKSARFNGTSGYISCGGAVATAALNSGVWSIECWVYPDATSSGTILAGAASATNRFRLEHSGNRFYFSAEVNGVTRSASLEYNTIGVWYHIVINSDGAMYVNSLAVTGTTAAGGRNSTNNFTIGSLNTGLANFFSGRIAEVAVYNYVISSSTVLNHWNVSSNVILPSGKTFGITCQSIVPEIFPMGADDTGSMDPSGNPATLVLDGGINVLELGGGTFKSMTFDNSTLFDKWAGKNEGTIRLQFKYSGTLASYMLCQIGDKVRNRINPPGGPPLPNEENNDGYRFYLSSSGGSATVSYGGGLNGITITISTSLSENTWYDAEIKWRASQAPYFSATINGVTSTSSTANRVGNMACQTLHHLLIGNDTALTPTSLRIKNVEVFNTWQS